MVELPDELDERTLVLVDGRDVVVVRTVVLLERLGVVPVVRTVVLLERVVLVPVLRTAEPVLLLEERDTELVLLTLRDGEVVTLLRVVERVADEVDVDLEVEVCERDVDVVTPPRTLLLP
jgi:hypothetical protein